MTARRRYAASNPAGYQTAANVTALLGPYALTANVLPLAGGTMTGLIHFVNGNAIDGAVGTARSMFGTTAGSKRWGAEFGTPDAEGGFNVGSNWALRSYTDTGALFQTPLSINRATSQITR